MEGCQIYAGRGRDRTPYKRLWQGGRRQQPTQAIATGETSHYPHIRAANACYTAKAARVSSRSLVLMGLPLFTLVNGIAVATASAIAVYSVYCARKLAIANRTLSQDINFRQRTETRLRAALDAARDAIVTVDRDRRIQGFNRAAESLFGYSAADAIGQAIELLLPEEIRPQLPDDPVAPCCDPRLAEASDSLTQVFARHKNGTLFPAEISISEDSVGSETIATLVLRDLATRQKVEAALTRQAFYDSLTELPNRVCFLNRLHRALHSPGEPFALLFLDLDRFKVVNDSLGHLVGDRLLADIARRLEPCVRSGDTLARLGGDEFTILLSGVSDREIATRVAERIQRALQAPFSLGDREVFVSASIGIALSCDDHHSPEDVLRDADMAMYEAKSQGRASYAVFDRQMHARAIARLQLETDLQHALERGEFAIYYQPIVSLKTGHLRGFEALVRWQHPKRGSISPSEFIPAAEEMGAISRLGMQVLRQACQQMGRWQQRWGDRFPLCLSVNLSHEQLPEPHLVESIVEILQDSGLDRAHLKLEITESTLAKPEAGPVLAELDRRQIRLSIDDFGTGYSSLSHLHQFPFQSLKVDRAFIEGMETSGEGAAIVRTIVELAGHLGLEAIAEGLTTREQALRLRGWGCEFGQGYFFSPPLDAAATEALIVSDRQWEI